MFLYPTAHVFVLVERIETQVIRTVFSTRIPNNQFPFVIDSTLNCSKTHLPVHQSIDPANLSTRINVYHYVATQIRIAMHCCMVIH